MGMSEARQEPPKRRGLWRRVGLVLGLLLLLFAALAFALTRPPVVARVLEAALARAGLGPASVSVERLDWSGVALGRSRLGGGAVEAASASVDLRWPALFLEGLAGIDKVTLDGLRLNAGVGEDGSVRLPFSSSDRKRRRRGIAAGGYLAQPPSQRRAA